MICSRPVMPRFEVSGLHVDTPKCIFKPCPHGNFYWEANFKKPNWWWRMWQYLFLGWAWLDDEGDIE